ncbi:hypothetical protein COOONC_16252 [Cooperia oncophora]
MVPPLRPEKKGRFDATYPPAKFAANACSPYFIGKHKLSRKRMEKGESSLSKYGFGGDGFKAGTQVEANARNDDAPKFPLVSRSSSMTAGSLNASNGLAFDFSNDPKLRRVREVIVSIVDSVSCGEEKRQRQRITRLQ